MKYLDFNDKLTSLCDDSLDLFLFFLMEIIVLNISMSFMHIY